MQNQMTLPSTLDPQIQNLNNHQPSPSHTHEQQQTNTGEHLQLKQLPSQTTITTNNPASVLRFIPTGLN
jgi:hypothetical protein